MASDYAPARVGSRTHVGCREEVEPPPPHFVSLTSYSTKTLAFAGLTRPGVVVLLLWSWSPQLKSKLSSARRLLRVDSPPPLFEQHRHGRQSGLLYFHAGFAQVETLAAVRTLLSRRARRPAGTRSRSRQWVPIVHEPLPSSRHALRAPGRYASQEPAFGLQQHLLHAERRSGASL